MHSRYVILLAVLLALVAQAVAAVAFQNPVLDGLLNDPDSYMRLRRVLHLHETGNWFDAFDFRTNAPYGEVLHWTRPLDAILYAGAWIGSAATEFRSALFFWGAVVGPVLLLAFIPVWSWGTRPVLTAGGLVLTFAIFPLFGLLNGTLRPGNADHHGLIAVLFLANIAIFVRLAHGEVARRAALAAGLIAGAAIWVSVIEIVAATCFGAALALLWLWRDRPFDRYLSAYLAGLVISVAVALAVERPPGTWLTPDFERLSIVHLVVVAAAGSAWIVARLAVARIGLANAFADRLATLVGFAIVSLGIVLLLFPAFFRGPLAEAGTPLITAWLRGNVELQPVWAGDRAILQQYLVNLAPAAVACGYIGWRWRSASPQLRNLFAVLLLGFVFYLPLALAAVRWVSFVQALTLLPFVLAIGAAWRWPGALAIGDRRVPLRMVAAAAVLTGPFFAAALVAGAEAALFAERGGTSSAAAASTANYVVRQRHCEVPAISKHLSRTYEGVTGDEILLTYLNWGPEIAWRTPYSVVGAPYTEPSSLQDTSRVFHAIVDTEAAEVVRRRGIDLILVCTDSFERYPGGGADSLHNRLVAQRPPPWLAPVRLPAELARAFRLYRVDVSALPD